MYANNMMHQKMTVKLSVNMATVDTNIDTKFLIINFPRR